MSCHDGALGGRLDDWIDGVLAPAAAAEVARHLERCADCRRDAEVLRALRRAAAALPAEREPARDLWGGIAARLREEPRELPEGADREPLPAGGGLPARAAGRRGGRSVRVWSGWLAAAACLAFALVTRAPDRTHGRAASSADAAAPGAGARVAPLLAATLRDLEAGSRQAQDEYLAALRGVEPEAAVPAADGVAILGGLRTIDVALAETRAALDREPGNPLLTRLLASGYAERIDLLRRATLAASRDLA
ncbi:MAG: zf-HC2 domain-containing protein [Candidatus Krumholzibacteriia bacterium]